FLLVLHFFIAYDRAERRQQGMAYIPDLIVYLPHFAFCQLFSKGFSSTFFNLFSGGIYLLRFHSDSFSYSCKESFQCSLAFRLSFRFLSRSTVFAFIEHYMSFRICPSVYEINFRNL